MSAPTPARRVAYEVLRRVFEHGAWADRAFRSAAERHRISGRDRAQAQHLAYGAVQRRGTSDWLIAELTSRPVERIEPPLVAALRLGMFELLFAGGAADHATVDQAVELAKGGRDGGRRHRGAGLVNAVMRRAAREGAGMLAAIDASNPEGAAIVNSIPPWIAELWFTERGAEEALGLMAAANEPPRRVYRVVSGRSAPAGVEPVAEAPAGVALVAHGEASWESIEAAVSAGELVPQSPGSALAAAALGVGSGERILDLCAAPGIKTTQLAEAAEPGGRVVAVERDPGRARELSEFCERAGRANVKVIEGDGAVVDLGAGYDRVLVDAPCTGLGTLASRPDARWQRDAADIPELAGLQERLLGAGLDALRPGGRAVYSVCTISRRESEGVLERVLAGREEIDPVDLTPLAPAAADPACEGALQLLPGSDAGEGFFVAALERRG